MSLLERQNALALAMCCALAFALSVLSARAESEPLLTVPSFDLDRYLGRWHQIALIPNRFQKKCIADTSAFYSRTAEGTVEVTNRCRTSNGTYKLITGEARAQKSWNNPAILEVRFAPKWLSFLSFVWADYWVIAIESDYSAALVGSPDRKYLWILARQPTLDDGVYRRLIDVAAQQGFAANSIQRTP
jgi:apolipoprotein D and lipocalin family protein